MYCRNCGKQIEDDSVFCKYCGKKILSEIPLSQNNGISACFLGLSKRKQIALIIYGIWLLCWLCYLIANADRRHFAEEYVFPFFLYTIVIPFIVVGVWHIYKINSKKKINVESPRAEVSSSTQSHIQSNELSLKIEVATQEGQLPSTMTPRVLFSTLLLNFARDNGKMQVVNKKISDGKYDRYCQFTSEDGKVIRVDFSERIGFLNSKEISENKYQLTVNKLADGSYCLDFIEDKQIDDALPF